MQILSSTFNSYASFYNFGSLLLSAKSTLQRLCDEAEAKLLAFEHSTPHYITSFEDQLRREELNTYKAELDIVSLLEAEFLDALSDEAKSELSPFLDRAEINRNNKEI